MASILTVSSSKGASGKTTLAILLALSLADQGRRVALIDADPNGTVSDWHKANYEGPPLTCFAETDHSAIVTKAYEVAEAHGVVIIDTAGFANLTATSAMAAADAVLIPCMADRGSVREAMRTHHHATSLAAAARRSIPGRIVLSQWTPRGLAEQAAMADLREGGIEPLDTVVPALAAFKQMSFTGTLPPGRAHETGLALMGELARIKFIERVRSQKGKA